ncbi:MAG: nucleotidyl transferase AbiEii/AbiGii toxin family protein, partial [Thiohalorhabdaceae bacterium]
DLSNALADGWASPERIVESFQAYMRHNGHTVSRAEFEENLVNKLKDRRFAADIGPLLAHGHAWDLDAMAQTVWDNLIGLLPGGPWQGGT